mmetsp:Transcript_65348/g.200049  ORF Transcript_65348/g.200049 Transcript_65348/m.200049 type:complete len:201 (-) Transcript_65348:521-1123(-)
MLVRAALLRLQNPRTATVLRRVLDVVCERSQGLQGKRISRNRTSALLHCVQRFLHAEKLHLVLSFRMVIDHDVFHVLRRTHGNGEHVVLRLENERVILHVGAELVVEYLCRPELRVPHRIKHADRIFCLIRALVPTISRHLLQLPGFRKELTGRDSLKGQLVVFVANEIRPVGHELMVLANVRAKHLAKLLVLRQLIPIQ